MCVVKSAWAVVRWILSNAKELKLSVDDIKELIDRMARERLNCSGEEFLRQSKEGTLEDSPAVRDIMMLVRFGEEKNHAGKANPVIRRLPKHRSEQDRDRRAVDAA